MTAVPGRPPVGRRIDPYDATTWGPPWELATGVWGVTVRWPDAFYLCAIIATEPGAGDVGRYLDALPRDECIKVPLVLSAQLASMLVHRGFVEQQVDTLHGPAEVFVRQAVRP